MEKPDLDKPFYDKPFYETQVYGAFRDVLISDLRHASFHMDTVDFLHLLAEIKEVIQYYERHVPTWEAQDTK